MATKPKKPAKKPAKPRANAGTWLKEKMAALGYPVVSYVNETEEFSAQVTLIDETNGTKKKGNVLLVEYDPGDAAFPIGLIGQRYTTRGGVGTSIRSSGFTEDDLSERNFKIEIAQIVQDMKFRPTGLALFDYNLQALEGELEDMRDDIASLESKIATHRLKFVK